MAGLRRAGSATLGEFGVVLGIALLVAGWWYARNVVLYGEPLGVSTMLDIFGRRTGPATPNFAHIAEFLVKYAATSA